MAVRSVVTPHMPPKRNREAEFPILMRYSNGVEGEVGWTILATGRGPNPFTIKGFVVDEGSQRVWQLGYASDTWSSDKFELLKDEAVTLHNLP